MRNFLSIGADSQAVSFEQSGLTLVLGRNVDIGSENSRNGVGKTSLLQGISYGLWGEPISEIKIDNLINNINNKQMQVTIEFEKDGTEYRVERGRKPTFLRLFVNDKTVETDEAQGENKHTQAEINRIIGMSHTLFEHIVGMNTYTTPFLKLKPALQKEVIEELLGITTLSARDEVLTGFIKTTKDKIKDAEATIKADMDANVRIQVAIDKATLELDRWTILHEQKTLSLQNKLDELSTIDFAYEIKCFDDLAEWSSQFKEMSDTVTTLSKEIDGINKEIVKSENDIKKLKTEIENQSDNQVKRLEDEASRHMMDAADTTAFTVKINRLTQDKKKAQQEIDRSPDEGTVIFKNQITRLRSEVLSKNKQLAVIQSEIDTVSAEIDNADAHTCSTCGQGLEGTSHLDQIIAKLNSKKANLQADHSTIKQAISKINQDIIELTANIDQATVDFSANQETYRERITAIGVEIEKAHTVEKERVEALEQKAVVIMDEVSAIQESLAAKYALVEVDIASIQDVIQEYVNIRQERIDLIAEINEGIAQLGSKPTVNFANKEAVWKLRETAEMVGRDLENHKSVQNPHIVNVMSLTETLTAIDTQSRDDLQNVLKHQDFLHKLLSGKDSFVRKRIIEGNLLYLNTQLNGYLEKLQLPHEVRFLSDLSVQISTMGRDLDFPQLSRGEMNRVMLATSFAFRDVWESLNTTLNLLFVDEMADTGLDESGIETALDILNKMALRKSVFLISHKESLMGRVNRIMLVYKEGGFTRFEPDAELVA